MLLPPVSTTPVKPASSFCVASCRMSRLNATRNGRVGAQKSGRRSRVGADPTARSTAAGTRTRGRGVRRTRRGGRGFRPVGVAGADQFGDAGDGVGEPVGTGREEDLGGPA